MIRWWIQSPDGCSGLTGLQPGISCRQHSSQSTCSHLPPCPRLVWAGWQVKFVTSVMANAFGNPFAENMGIARPDILTFARPPVKNNVFQELLVIKKLLYRWSMSCPFVYNGC